jgi:hypothetical protein
MIFPTASSFSRTPHADAARTRARGSRPAAGRRRPSRPAPPAGSRSVAPGEWPSTLGALAELARPAATCRRTMPLAPGCGPCMRSAKPRAGAGFSLASPCASTPAALAGPVLQGAQAWPPGQPSDRPLCVAHVASRPSPVTALSAGRNGAIGPGRWTRTLLQFGASARLLSHISHPGACCRSLRGHLKMAPPLGPALRPAPSSYGHYTPRLRRVRCTAPPSPLQIASRLHSISNPIFDLCPDRTNDSTCDGDYLCMGRLTA